MVEIEKEIGFNHHKKIAERNEKSMQYWKSLNVCRLFHHIPKNIDKLPVNKFGNFKKNKKDKQKKEKCKKQEMKKYEYRGNIWVIKFIVWLNILLWVISTLYKACKESSANIIKIPNYFLFIIIGYIIFFIIFWIFYSKA